MMNVSITLDHPAAAFTNGDMICGNVVLYCPNTVTVSKITASLTGESCLSLNNTTGSLLSWKQEEKHRFVHQSQVIIPHRYEEESRRDPVKLGFGYHSFWFGLRIPESPDCCTCPPNSPVFLSGIEKQGSRSGDLPPSMNNLVDGVDVSYRIDITVTTMRSVFKSTTTTTLPITIWPLDPQLPCAFLPTNAFSCTEAVTAKILGPATQLPPNNHRHSSRDPYLISTTHETANLLITSHFLPDYTFTNNRTVAMRLRVKQINSTSHDLYLQSFQMLVLGYTDTKVGAVTNTQMCCSTIVSLSNLDLKICNANSDIGMEYEVDPHLWEGKRLPNDIVPSFESCGLARRYEVEILMGFQCRGAKDGRVLFVQSRTPVRISSGMYPNCRLPAKSEGGMVDDVTVPHYHEGLSAYNDVANGLRYDDRQTKRDIGDDYTAIIPPTYEEAIRIGMKPEMQKETDPTCGR